MKRNILLLFILFFSFLVKGQNNKVGLRLSGFISSEAIFDSRQVIAARDGEVLLFPSPKKYDKKGNDINEGGSFNFLNIHTRLRVRTTPFKLWGGHLDALIETDFYGRANDKIGLLRLRHAMLKYDYRNISVMVGQYWHPMFVTSCIPTTSSWSAGTPGGVGSRNPQLRFTYHFSKNFRASIAALSQLDFKSDGPQGAKSDYIRNSQIPEFDIHAEYGNSEKWVIGGVAGTKSLQPRRINAQGNKVEEEIRTYHALAYAKVVSPKMEYKLQGIYAEDGYNLLLLGGYVVSDIEAATGRYSYTPLSSFTTWFEASSRYSGIVNFGLFVAYAKNLGAREQAMPEKGLYGRGSNINELIKVSPRIIWGHKTFQVMLELNQLYAFYGTPDKKMHVKNTEKVGNTRLQLHFKYAF